MIVVTVFLSILNQIDFHLAQNREENCHHDQIPFNVKGNGSIVFSVWSMVVKRMQIRWQSIWRRQKCRIEFFLRTSEQWECFCGGEWAVLFGALFVVFSVNLHWETFSHSCWYKLYLYCNCTFPVDLAPNQWEKYDQIIGNFGNKIQKIFLLCVSASCFF